MTPDNGIPGAEDALGLVATKVAASLEKTELAPLIEAFDSTRQLPRQLDGKLLSGGRSAIGRDLEPVEKKRMRNRVVELCRRRLAE